MKALLIAEKPSLMKEIKAVYDKYGHKDTIVFKCFAGHVMTLKEPKDYNEDWEKWRMDLLPMIPEQFGYKPSKDKMAMFKELRDEIKNGGYDYIINGCDADREGENIFKSFNSSIGCKLPIKRFWNSELTEDSIKKSLDNLYDDEEWIKNLGTAARLRGYFDWLIGLNGTRSFSLVTRAQKAVNIGRVMTPTLRFIVDRELELQNFVSKPFWEVEADFGTYKGTYFAHQEENETKFFDKSKATQLLSQLGNQGKVITVNKKRVTRYAPQLHSLQELQNEASKVYGYSMDQTLKIAQRLYEAKILTYPRTDSGYISTAIAAELAPRFKSACQFDDLKPDAQRIMSSPDLIKAMCNNKRYVDDKKVGGHFGIMPTGSTPNMNTLATEDKNIFYLVCRRLVGIFLPPMITNNTEVVTEANGNRFKTTGKQIIDLGYSKIFKQKTNETILPPIAEGEVYSIKQAQLVEKKTTPPQRYTDETLGKAMENAGRFIEDAELKDVMKKAKGLGTPATRGGIVKKLEVLKMIERNKNAYTATEYGISIIQSLGDRDITRPELTAVWEEKLGKIEDGEYNPKQFYSEMIEYTRTLTDDLKTMAVQTTYEDKITSSKEVVGVCPKCGGDMITGKSGYRCQNYKNPCTVFIPSTFCKASITKTDMKQMLAGKTTKPKKCESAKGWKGEAAFKINTEGQLQMVFEQKKKS